MSLSQADTHRLTALEREIEELKEERAECKAAIKRLELSIAQEPDVHRQEALENKRTFENRKDVLDQRLVVLEAQHYRLLATASAPPQPALTVPKAVEPEPLVQYLEFPDTQESASSIANHHLSYYDVFSAVCPPGSYIDNTRVREIFSIQPDPAKVERLRHKLHSTLQLPDTFRLIPGGSESRLLDPYMKQCVQDALDISNEIDLFSISSVFANGTALCSQLKSDSQLCFKAQGTKDNYIPAVFFEVKGVHDSVLESEPQLLSAAGGGAVYLRHRGMPRERCVVPAVSLTGAGFQFFAVYLLEPTFPVMVALSPTLSPFSPWSQEQEDIARWMLRMVSFAADTRDLFRHERLMANTTGALLPNKALLEVDSFFFKPIRFGPKLGGGSCTSRVSAGGGYSSSAIGKIADGASSSSAGRRSAGNASSSSAGRKRKSAGSSELVEPTKKVNLNFALDAGFSKRRVRLNAMFVVYERLYNALQNTPCELSNSCILFPRGVINVPGEDVPIFSPLQQMLVDRCSPYFTDIENFTHHPLVVFDKLHDWTNVKPPSHLRSAYMTRVREAVCLLNRARVAHLDLRAANIMWREKQANKDSTTGEPAVDVNIKVIDFEDAVLFDRIIPQWYVETIVKTRDSRYPFAFNSTVVPTADLIAGPAHNEFYLSVISAWLDNNEESFDEFMQSPEGRALHHSLVV